MIGMQCRGASWRGCPLVLWKETPVFFQQDMAWLTVSYTGKLLSNGVAVVTVVAVVVAAVDCGATVHAQLSPAWLREARHVSQTIKSTHGKGLLQLGLVHLAALRDLARGQKRSQTGHSEFPQGCLRTLDLLLLRAGYQEAHSTEGGRSGLAGAIKGQETWMCSAFHGAIRGDFPN